MTFGCPDCGARARRVPDVIDAWYDSGSMPFARLGAPWRSEAEFERAFPAQFICEAIDQTRGWFYSLMAVSTIVFGRSSYENVVCLGLVVDEEGRKMSKHVGNVLEPLPLMEQHGADALRWFFAASGSPWSTRRVGHAALEEIVRKVLLTYWNTVSFLALYANAAAADGNAWGPERLSEAPPPAAGRCWTGRSSASCTPWCGTSPPRWRASTPRARDGASQPSPMTCPTGMCAGHAVGSGKAHGLRSPARRSPRCTSAWRR